MTGLFYLLLLLSPLSSLLLASVFAKVFVSIDCGSSLSSYTDDHTIEWVGDSLYIQNGENYNVVAPEDIPGWDTSHVMSTLRVFTTQKKNCYSIEADKGERVFIRATFYYGNYDNKSSPPTFNILVDGNLMSKVTTTIEFIHFHEAVYTVKGNTISVCVAQTQPGQLPFISSLEVRSLDEGMYDHIDKDYPLFFGQRLAFGTENITRYPDDAYDRIWLPALVDNTSIKVTSDSPSIAVDDAKDNPPKSVIRTAMMPLDPSATVLGRSFNFSGAQVPIYFNTYFSEVSKLNSTQNRSFIVFVNNEPVNNGRPIIPPYGRALELRITNVTASKNLTQISLVRTTDSTLPPLISAMEVFIVQSKQTEGTHSNDVSSLALLQKSFIQLQDWTGDPCLPSLYTWDWVGCSLDLDNPRITALYLNDFGLVGSLPDFSGLDALETIDLHNNSLVQEFPDFLESFSQLRVLNLANNNFSGTVPSSLSENEDLKLIISGNPHLCMSDISCKNGTVQPPSTNSPPASGNIKLKSSNMLPFILGTLILILG